MEYRYTAVDRNAKYGNKTEYSRFSLAKPAKFVTLHDRQTVVPGIGFRVRLPPIGQRLSGEHLGQFLQKQEDWEDEKNIF